jgi:hypothetical protein
MADCVNLIGTRHDDPNGTHPWALIGMAETVDSRDKRGPFQDLF